MVMREKTKLTGGWVFTGWNDAVAWGGQGHCGGGCGWVYKGMVRL